MAAKIAKNEPTKLDDFLRLWLKAKMREFYRLDPYLKNLHGEIALSHFVDCLISATTVPELLTKLSVNDDGRGLRLSRKGDGKSYFEYPSLAFQIESLVALWPKICALYSNKRLLETSDRFGHRPNLLSNYSALSPESSIYEKDARTNCSLKIPFQEDYPAFKKAVVDQAESILKKSRSSSTAVLVIQSDIEKFFHRLKVGVVSKFIERHFPELWPLSGTFLNRLESDFKFTSLPIGWSLSGIYADLIAVQFHEVLNKNVNDQLKRSLAAVDLTNYAKKVLSTDELSSEWIKGLPGLVETANLSYKNVVNYVDDFLFFLEFNISEQFKDRRLINAFERIVAHLVLELSEVLINSIFSEDLGLKLYRPDDDKGKHFSFDQTNIDTLSSNFFSIAQDNLPSDPEEPNLWTRLDEFLLPADNDLTLNERTQFFSHLANIRNKVLEGDRLEKGERDDIFKKILLKMKGAEAKYITSVMKLVEVLMISHPSEYFEFGLDIIPKLRNEFEKASKPLELWLRFFAAYFRMVTRLSFDSRFTFFDDFDRFAVFWGRSDGSTPDDLDLLNAIRVTFLLKYILSSTRNSSEWIEGMTRKRQSRMDSGILSRRFLAFNVSPKAKKIRVHFNAASDGLAIAALFKEAVKYRRVTVGEYGSTGKHIRRKIGLESAALFVNASAYGIVPSWGTGEIDTFISELNAIVSAQYANSVRRLLNRAKAHDKTIGRSYRDRLSHAKSVLIDRAGSRINNIPGAFGGGNPNNYRSLIFYLMTLQSNALPDLQRAYLASLAPIDFFRDFNFLLAPVASRVSGLGFIQIIRGFVGWQKKSFSVQGLRGVAASIITRELAIHAQGSSALKQFKMDGVSVINLSDLGPPFSKKEKVLLLTLCPISIDAKKDFDPHRGLSFVTGVHERLDLKIESAIIEAKRRGASGIVFPELCLPRRYLHRYLSMCASRGLLLIAGLEYSSDHSIYCRNATIISIPVQGAEAMFGRKYIAFEQDKHFPAAKEKEWLETGTIFKYSPGRNLFVFTSKLYLNFAVLTCSDFLSMRLRLKLQERIQTLFVPAQSEDTTTYNHIAETCIRDLHCFAVVCNNQELGASFVYAPFYEKNERVIFNKEGSTLPEFLTMKWTPSAVLKSQEAESQTPFRPKDKENTDPNLARMKQTPPDWGH